MKRIALLAGVALAFVAGCQSVPSGIDPSYHVKDARLLGEWAGPGATEIDVEYAGGDAFELEVSDGKSEETYRGHMLEISGKRFAEVSLFQPDHKDEVPVYLYAMVEVNGDTMIHRPLRAQWLSEASKSMSGAIYKSTAEEQAGSGGVVVRDRAAMLELLKKAASDPSAFDPPETLTRKKN